MKKSAEMVNEKNMEKTIEAAVRWLKERGVNPHVHKKDIVLMGAFEALLSGRATFSMLTGCIRVPDIYELYDVVWDTSRFEGILEHELFHRADYMEKFGGSKKLRKKLYQKWAAGKALMLYLEKHRKYIDGKHPFRQAIRELKARGYNTTESIVKLWCASPVKFKEALEEATSLRTARASKGGAQANPELDAREKQLKEYFTSARVRAVDRQRYFRLLSEIPAYMIKYYVQGMSPEEGLRKTKKKILSQANFGGTELRKMVVRAVKEYTSIVKALRKAGCNDDEVIRGVLAIHKNIYTLRDVEAFANMEKKEKMISTAAKAVRSWVGSRDIREGISAQALGRMEKIASKAINAMGKERSKGPA